MTPLNRHYQPRCEDESEKRPSPPTFCTRAKILANGINTGSTVQARVRLALVDVLVAVPALVALLTLARETAKVVGARSVELARIWL